MAMSYNYAIVLRDRAREDVLCRDSKGQFLIFGSAADARHSLGEIPGILRPRFRVKRIGLCLTGGKLWQ